MRRDLEVRQCRVLVAVKDGGSVSAAARLLGVAQSTVSETLLSLERLVGTPITVRRIGREAMLTEAAEAMLPHARALIAASETALAAGARQSQAKIRFGTVESISSYLLPGPLRDFRILWPQVDVQITIGLCADLRKRVERSELDAALTVEGPSGAGDAPAVRESWPARLRLVVDPNHPLAGQSVGRRDLETQSYLLTDPDGAFNGLMRGWLRNVEHAPRLESAGSVDGVKRGVRRGDVVGVLPEYALTEELAAGALLPFDSDNPLPSIALHLTTMDAPRANSPLESLIGKIRDELGASSGRG